MIWFNDQRNFFIRIPKVASKNPRRATGCRNGTYNSPKDLFISIENRKKLPIWKTIFLGVNRTLNAMRLGLDCVWWWWNQNTRWLHAHPKTFSKLHEPGTRNMHVTSSPTYIKTHAYKIIYIPTVSTCIPMWYNI